MKNEYIIRRYNINDAPETGILIADTYRKYNLDYISDDEISNYLGGFYHCRSSQREHRNKIIDLIHAPIVYVAVSKEAIVGVLRGSSGRLHSLFVSEDHHRQGIGGSLLGYFEDECRRLDSRKITLAASLYAVPFYIAMGYKKSTGTRKSRSFEGTDFYIQPMKKNL